MKTRILLNDIEDEEIEYQNNEKNKKIKFDYILSNPPYSKKDWKEVIKYRPIFEEYEISENAVGDYAFVISMLDNLKDDGKMAIIQNGSPLFSGAAGSGESEIRRYIIENDWLEAIVQLPTDLFYNTSISTYIWIINKGKEGTLREGKVQLIDASNCYINRRKNIGNKRKDLDDDSRKLILKAYDEFSNKEYKDKDKTVGSKIFNNEDFGYNRITIESPELDENQKVIKDKKGNIKADTSQRDYENVPLKENIDEYFEREILPYNKEVWIDKKKTQIGYEIPFTRYFYKYVAPEKSDDILVRIKNDENNIIDSLKRLFKEEK